MQIRRSEVWGQRKAQGAGVRYSYDVCAKSKAYIGLCLFVACCTLGRTKKNEDIDRQNNQVSPTVWEGSLKSMQYNIHNKSGMRGGGARAQRSNENADQEVPKCNGSHKRWHEAETCCREIRCVRTPFEQMDEDGGRRNANRRCACLSGLEANAIRIPASGSGLV